MSLGRFVVISLVAMSLNCLTAMAADTPSTPADQMGRKEKVALEVTQSITLQGPSSNRGSVIEVVFENGSLVTDVNWLEKKERCFLTIRLENDDFFEMLDSGKYPTFILQPGFMKLSQHETAGDFRPGVDTHFRVTGIRFAINWLESTPGSQYYIAAGTPLSRQDGKPTKSRAVGLGCNGNDLRWSDLNRAFGANSMNVYEMIKY